ncbi:MAG: hypothetical protein AAGH17_04355 [Pseudomonadota bacterium]
MKARTVPTSGAFAGAALGLSAAVHFAALLTFEAPRNALIEGGQAVAVAVQGTSFADLAQGVTDPVEPTATEDPRQADTQPPATQPDRLRATQPAQAPQSTVTPQRENAVAVPVQPSAAIGDVSAAVVPNLATTPAPLTVAPSVTSPVPRAAIPSPAARSVAPAVLPPTQTAQPIVPSSRTQTQAAPTTPTVTGPVSNADNAETTPLVSARPVVRPESVERKGREAAERAAANARRIQANRAQSAPRPAGNANRNATRGTATNSRQGTATSSGSSRSSSAGNAAISNYQGQVQTCVARAASRARTQSGGRVNVSFSVGGNGRIGSVSVSGNARAARAVQSAVSGARCPRPPAGAPRSYSVVVVVR